jgi:hypothetical protein
MNTSSSQIYYPSIHIPKPHNGKCTSANEKEKDYIKIRAIVRGVKRHCTFHEQLTRES